MRTEEPVVTLSGRSRPNHGDALVAPQADARDENFDFLDARYPQGLNATGSVQQIAANRVIYCEGDAVETLFKVVSGVVRTCKFLNNGQRQINAFHGAGDLFGFETAMTHGLTAEAVCNATVIAYPCRGVEALAAKSKDLSHQLLYYAIRNLVQAQEHAVLLGRKGANEKVASFLMEWSAWFPAGDLLVLAMSRRDIADYLGLSIETVSRTLSHFERRALIAVPSVRHIKLINLAALRDLSF
jgi:CRP/FNR family nitrogen fixation transcriptional regulator